MPGMAAKERVNEPSAVPHRPGFGAHLSVKCIVTAVPAASARLVHGSLSPPESSCFSPTKGRSDEIDPQRLPSRSVTRGHSPSKTGVNALMSRGPRLGTHYADLSEIAGT